MTDDRIVTVRTYGLTSKQVLDRLGGIGDGKPVRAIVLGEDLFGKLNQVEAWLRKQELQRVQEEDLAELWEILEGDGSC